MSGTAYTDDSYEEECWIELALDLNTKDLPTLHKELCSIISNKTASRFWITKQLDNLYYRIFSSFEEMAEILWYGWSCDDLETFQKEFSVAKEAPALISERGNEVFFLKDFACLDEFYSASIQNIKTNPRDDSDY